MHISTHHDRIFAAGCLEKEYAIRDLLNKHGVNNLLADAVQTPLDQLPVPFATDNQFRVPVDYINLAPEFWHVHLCPEYTKNIYPNKRFTCYMNRVSGERLMLLYKLQLADLLKHGIVSFNCLYHDMDPDVAQRKANFSQVHNMCGWTQWDHVHETLQEAMPMLNTLDPDEAAMRSDLTVVVESYVSDTVIAFSEKVFRALQTPRPWVMLASPDAVKTLRDSGFDLLDDVVNHDYDSIEDLETRIDALIEQIKKPQYFYLPRYQQAVNHNRSLLQRFEQQWPHKLSNLLQSTGV